MVIGLGFWYFSTKLKNDSGIRMAEGETDFNILATDDDRGERTKPVFSIKIGSLTFRVKEKIFDAISKGKIRVYYFSTPVKIILSAEILEQYNWRDSK